MIYFGRILPSVENRFFIVLFERRNGVVPEFELFAFYLPPARGRSGPIAVSACRPRVRGSRKITNHWSAGEPTWGDMALLVFLKTGLPRKPAGFFTPSKPPPPTPCRRWCEGQK